MVYKDYIMINSISSNLKVLIDILMIPDLGHFSCSCFNLYTVPAIEGELGATKSEVSLLSRAH